MIPAMYGISGILAALYSREKTGEGERIDISMQDACFSMIMDEALDFHLKMGIPMRTGNRNPRLAPWNAYKAKDGYIIICVANNVQWQAFTEALGREDLKEDARFKNQEGRSKNSDEVEKIVLEWLKDLTVEEALSRLREKKVACDTVFEIEQVLEDPQLTHRGMIQELNHPSTGGTGIKTAGFPIHFSERQAGLSEPAPYPGENNEEIYGGLLGMSDEEMMRLKEEGII
jgi:crotonobetainyl-CoA:carnitine CoA-transferase CaiB-like acyl-CoA transferase